MKRKNTIGAVAPTASPGSGVGHFSKSKGKRGERELAHELTRVLGVTARRGVQFHGSPDSPDVVTDIPEVHIECKRTERFRLYEALDQAVHDAGTSNVPVVCHRQNNKPWVIVLRLDDLSRFANIISQLEHDRNNDPKHPAENDHF